VLGFICSTSAKISCANPFGMLCSVAQMIITKIGSNILFFMTTEKQDAGVCNRVWKRATAREPCVKESITKHWSVARPLAVLQSCGDLPTSRLGIQSHVALTAKHSRKTLFGKATSSTSPRRLPTRKKTPFKRG
jgi:hypothetical protein